MPFVLPELLEKSAVKYPEKAAIVFDKETVGFGELQSRVTQLADRLHMLGVERGDRIVVCLGNSVDAIVAFWGALAAGAVVSMIAIDITPDKLRYILSNSGARVVILRAEAFDGFRAGIAEAGTPITLALDGANLEEQQGVLDFHAQFSLPGRTRERKHRPISVDLASIIYTSGSTGDPKGVVLTHRNMVAAFESLQAYLHYRSYDVVLCPLPISFDYGLYQIILAAAVGATLILEREGQLPTALLRDIQQHKCTILPGIATLYHLIDRYSAMGRFDLSSVRAVTNTGMALQPSHVQSLKRLFPQAQIFSMYGLTECKRTTWLPPEEIDTRPDSVGVAIPNTEIMIVDDEGRPCSDGEIGQLVVRGETVMQGYWRDPDKTAEKIGTHPIFGDRCLFTGDRGYLDKDGYFHFTGRSDDVVKLRGRKVVTGEIERILHRHEEVGEAAVIVVEVDGDAEIVAFHNARHVSPNDLRAHCARFLESYQIPGSFFALSSLPKGINGKIDRRELRAILEVERTPAEVA